MVSSELNRPCGRSASNEGPSIDVVDVSGGDGRVEVKAYVDLAEDGPA